MPDLPTIPGFAVRDELGRGAMGVVYDGVHEDTRFEVALKVVRPDSDKARVALENEILAMARLNHRNLLYVYDFGALDDQGAVWMALEKASGGSLESWLPDRWSQVDWVLEPLLAGLAHAHARGMVHRDLKPANLLFASEKDHRPGWKIADFGLTTVRGVESAVKRAGTPLYMAPEQARPSLGETGPWSDLYGLGAVLWWWVCGRPVFDGSIKEVVRQHIEAPLPAFEPRFAVPDGLESLLRRMLTKVPGERPGSVADVREALGTQPRSISVAFETASSGSASARLPGIGMSLLALRDWRLVGRTTERHALIDVFRTVCLEEAPGMVLFTGPKGVGKTRLMRWLAETAAEAGLARVVWQPDDLGRALAMARRGPTVVCFDELTPQRESLLASLCYSGLPILGLATAERVEDWPEIDLLPGYHRLKVVPMLPAEFRDLLLTEFGLSESMTVRMDRLCGYLPGIAVDWIQDLARQELLESIPTGFVVDPKVLTRPRMAEDGDLRALRQLLERHGDAASALRLAAVLGQEVDGREWLPLLDHQGVEVPHDGLHDLARAELIERREMGFAWVSPVIRDAVLAPTATEAEHLGAASVLAELPTNRDREFRRALHLLHGGRPEEARTILLSADRQVDLDEIEALREAMDALRPGMHSASSLERVCFLLMDLRVVLNLVSGPAAVSRADALLAAVGTPSTPGPDADVPAELLQEAREFAARIYAFESLPDKALSLLDELDETPATLRCRALVLGDLGKHEEALALLLKAWEQSEHRGQRARLANGIGAALGRLGRHDEALVWFDRTLGLLEEPQHYVPYGNIAMSLLCLGRDAEALDAAHAAFDNAQHKGARRVASSAVVYGVAAALADESELPRIADQALFSLKRYGVGDGRLLRDALERCRPRRTATREFVRGMLYELQ